MGKSGRGGFLNTLGEIEEKLREKGYRITKQRQSIVRVFIQEQENILTAQEIYERVLKIDSRVNFSTVYRNIEILEEIGIIHRIFTGEGCGCYKLNEEKEHHHHFICKNCGKTEVIDFCPLKEMEEQLEKKNFVPTEHSFEIFGYCDKCNAKR